MGMKMRTDYRRHRSGHVIKRLSEQAEHKAPEWRTQVDFKAALDKAEMPIL